MTAPYGRIVVAAGGDAADDGLFAYAATVGDLLPVSQIRVMYALPPSLSARAQRPVHERLEAGPPAELQRAAAAGRVSVDAHAGAELDAILHQADAFAADLIIVGGREHTGGRRPLSRQLAMKAPCSVWMVPDRSPAHLTAVLAPIDLSGRSADALGVATALAAAASLPACHVLHVHFDPATSGFDEYREEAEYAELSDVVIFTARVDNHGVRLETARVESGDITSTILRTAAASGTDLIVMGTRGRSSAAAAMLGSQTDDVLMRSPVPVLAVKHFGASMRFRDALRDGRARWRGGPKFT